MFVSTVLASILLPALAGFLMLDVGFRRSSSGLKAAGVIAPTTIGFVLPYLFFSHAANEIRAAGDYVCGAFGAVAVIFTGGLALLELLVSVILFVTFSLVYRAKRRRVRAAG